ncbi:MAG: ribosome biogenesis GTPase YlqF [Deltaproteobacteria bacterium]|nr:ribosome biogenesis GTPase YlqF [Deltaproteobacteria bacterium]
MKINWYPGHMKRARRRIADMLPRIDVVIEVLDARLPMSSANPILRELNRHKPCIKVLNKDDLADPEVTQEWVGYFEKEDGIRALPLEAKESLSVACLPKLCRNLAPRRGKPGRPLRTMVVGIPNVGKSTLINSLAGKRVARVGNRPALTTCPQQIDLHNHILLSDTPGLLWPRLDNRNGAYRLAVSGAIGDKAVDDADLALFAAGFMAVRYPEQVMRRYKFETMPGTAAEIIEEIGRRRGCLISGGHIDVQRTAGLFLRELRSGKLGRVSFERPEDMFVEENLEI